MTAAARSAPFPQVISLTEDLLMTAQQQQQQYHAAQGGFAGAAAAAAAAAGGAGGEGDLSTEVPQRPQPNAVRRPTLAGPAGRLLGRRSACSTVHRLCDMCVSAHPSAEA